MEPEEQTAVVVVTPTPDPEPAAEAVADAAESAADAATEIAATEADARVEVAGIEAARDVAIVEASGETALEIERIRAEKDERIAWLEGQLSACQTTISELSARLNLNTAETPPETVVVEATDLENGTNLTLTSTSPETNETLTEVIAESAAPDGDPGEGPAAPVRKRRAFI